MLLSPIYENIKRIISDDEWSIMIQGQDFPLNWEKGFIVIYALVTQPIPTMAFERASVEEHRGLVNNTYRQLMKTSVRIEASKYYNAASEGIATPRGIIEKIKLGLQSDSSAAHFRACHQSFMPNFGSGISNDIFTDNTTWKQKSTTEFAIQHEEAYSEKTQRLLRVNLNMEDFS